MKGGTKSGHVYHVAAGASIMVAVVCPSSQRNFSGLPQRQHRFSPCLGIVK